MFAIRRLGLSTVNLPTQCEIVISVHYKDMKDDTKCEKWG